MAKQVKMLYRSEDNRIIGGVCGGIGEYLGIDPAVIRVIYALMTIFTGLIPGTIIYIALLFIIPQKPSAKRRR